MNDILRECVFMAYMGREGVEMSDKWLQDLTIIEKFAGMERAFNSLRNEYETIEYMAAHGEEVTCQEFEHSRAAYELSEQVWPLLCSFFQEHIQTLTFPGSDWECMGEVYTLKSFPPSLLM
jgi:hypothetical protein